MSTRPSLAALLRTRSRRDVAAFVGALYDARGARTRVDEATVVVDGDRYLVVEAGRWARVRERFGSPRPPPDSVDTVVAVDGTRVSTLGERYDAPVLTPTDLDRLARYGLDRAVADRLFRSFFERPVGDISPASRVAGDRASPPPTVGHTDGVRDAHPPGPRVPQSAVLAILVVASLVAFGAAGSSTVGPVVDSRDGSGGLPGSDSTNPGAGADEVGVANEPRPTTTPQSERRSLAPGLSLEGVVDSQALADAHARTLANRSYTWELVYVEYAKDTESGRATEVVRVERPTVYTTNVTTEGFLSARGPISFRSSYADGDRRYRPTADGVDSEPIEQRGTAGLQEARAARYYGILLDGVETSVVRTILGEPRIYVVDIQGTSASSVRNYTATAHVAPDGAVVYYSGSYCYVSFRGDDTRETCLSLTMQYRNVGQTTVDPPSWYTEGVSVPTFSTGTAWSPTPTASTGTPTASATPPASTRQANETVSQPTTTSPHRRQPDATGAIQE